MREWQPAQVGFERCISNCWRTVALGLFLVVSSSGGTLFGGGGGGAFRMFSRIHLPRSTGDVRVAYDETVSTLACVSTPPRGVFFSSTLRNSAPFTSAMP